MTFFTPFAPTKTTKAIVATLAFGLMSIYVPLAHASKSDKADVKHFLEEYLEVNKISGGVVMIEASDINIVVASGISNRSDNTAMTNDKRFYLASLGKTMVAAAILDAVKKKELKLSTLIVDQIPNMIGLDQLKGIRSVTIVQLLNHTSGLAEYLNDEFWEASLDDPMRKWRAEEALEFAHGLPTEFRAGGDFQYTNTNYVLLGAILENLDGSLSESLTKRVLRPSGMTNATVGADPSDKTLVRGYDDNGNDYSEIVWRSPLGDGPVVGTVTDIKRFVDALFNDKLFTTTKLFSQMVKGNRWDRSYGLGIGIETDDFGKWYGHSGGFDGFEADFRYYPEHDLTITYTVNGNQIEDVSLIDGIASWYFGK